MSAKYCPFCLSLNVLTKYKYINENVIAHINQIHHNKWLLSVAKAQLNNLILTLITLYSMLYML